MTETLSTEARGRFMPPQVTIVIVTDLLFTPRMKGSYNRVNAYEKYLRMHHKVVVIRDHLAEHLREFPDTDFAIIPYIWNAPLLRDAPPRNKVKFIVDTHDCMSARTESFQAAGVECRRPYTAAEEKRLLEAFDYIMAITEDDANRFRGMGFENVFTVPYKYDPPLQKLKLGFIGSAAAHNVASIRWFYESVFRGRLEAAFDLYVCGEVASTELRALWRDDESVCFYSPICKIEDFYRLIDIAINPARLGSGMATKNLEALAFMKPLITTSIGLVGMAPYSSAIMKADTIGEWTAVLEGIAAAKDTFFAGVCDRIRDVLQNGHDEIVYDELSRVLAKARPAAS